MKVTSLCVFDVKNRYVGFFHASYSYGRQFTLFENGKKSTKGGQVCTLQWSHLCLRNSLKIATRICQFSQYLGTKLDMLFEIAK